MKYFGTDLTTHGHYVFELSDSSMTKLGINFKGLPFHPEQLTNDLVKGSVIYYQGGGFTVIGISGSCVDTRSGTKSIFWVNDILTRSQMIDLIFKTPIAKRIIDQLDFLINWQ